MPGLSGREAYRLRKLQQLGANAWRTAHNPPAEALLTAADRQGVLVWDENHRNGQDEEMEVSKGSLHTMRNRS